MRKWISMCCLVIALLAVGSIKADAAEAPVLALGADLTEDQKAIVFSEMGITAEQAASEIMQKGSLYLAE